MTKLPPLKESVVQRQILAYLKAKGIFARRNNVGMIPNDKGGFRSSRERGASDIYGGIPPSGRLFVIEVKREGWTPPKSGKKLAAWLEQKAFLDEAARVGGLAIIARSLQDVVKVIG